MTQIKIGDTFYVFDENHRVYKKDGNGGPIYREHFRPVKITGETSRSWIYGPYDAKAPKANPWGQLNTPEMVDDKCWDNSHRYRVADAVKRVSTDDLRKIAELIGYKP